MPEKRCSPLALVIDANTAFRRLLVDAFQKILNIRVVTGISIDEACIIMDQHRPESDDPLDLVVLDVQITEGYDGVEVLNRFREYRLISLDCPIMLFTTQPSYKNCIEAINAGVTDYIPKSEVMDGQDGFDKFAQSCAPYVSGKASIARRVTAIEEWLTRNQQWLNERFSGQWIAPVAVNAAQKAGIAVESREGVAILHGDSCENLTRQIIDFPSIRCSLPRIFYVQSIRVESFDTVYEE
jgi:CheY-like chemotaxis protein